MTIKIERVVVTGGRKFTDYARIEADLRALLPCGLKRVAQGGHNVPDHDTGPTDWRPNKSADALALFACSVIDIEGATYKVRREVDGPWPHAGPRRNIRMLEAEHPDLVLAYPDPDSRGTWHCVREALKRGIPVAMWAPWAAAECVIGRVTPPFLFDSAPRFILKASARAAELGRGPLPSAERLTEALNGR